MRKVTLLIALFYFSEVNSQIIRANPYYRPFAVASGNLLLDDYTDAAAAYSLRKLDKDYSGSAIRVRRSSDNTEQDIGFLSSGELDTASLKSFVGTGGSDDGAVVTWYSQTGSGNISQSTSGNQPLIVDNGVVQRQGAKPAVKFVASSSHYLDGGDILDLSEMYLNAYAVAKLGSASNQTVFGKSNAGEAAGRWSLLKDANILYSVLDDAANTNRFASVSYTNTDNSLFEIYINKSADSNQLRKNVSQIAVNTGAIDDGAGNNAFKFYVGAYQTSGGTAPLSGYYLDGTVSEIIVYRKYWTSSERSAISSNINSFYSIY